MAKRKGSKRGGKKRVKKAPVEPAPQPENHEPVVEEEEEVPEEPAVETPVQEAEPADLDLDDTGSPSTMEPEPSPSLDGDHSKDGSGTESETMHTGFMQTGPNNYRCGSTLIDLTKADEETHFNFKTVPKDIALEVECGDNRAMMYLSKLYQGSKGHCIEFQGNWITPNEFQAVSGRESAKDWKRSIRHHGRSLKLLLSKGVLDVHPAACRCDSCRLLQQSNGKAPSVDGQSGDEKQSKSTTPKKKKKDKDKEKEKSEDQSKPKKEKELEEKAEVNGDVPVVNSDNVPLLGGKPADDKEANSSSDSSSSSDEEDSSEDESDTEKKPPAKPECLFPEPAEQPKRVEAIKVKIPRNLPTNPESSSSDSSSSGDSSDDDSDDDGSSDEEEQNTESVPPFDPASLNEPLFPNLKSTVIVKKPLPPSKPKKESSSEDDEPLANINRKLNIKLEESKPAEETPEKPPEQDLKDIEADMVIKASETQQSDVLLDATMKEEVSTEEKMETENEDQGPEPVKTEQLDVMPEDNALSMDVPLPEQETEPTAEVNDKPTQNEVEMTNDIDTEPTDEPAQDIESNISPPKENGAELLTPLSTEPSVETPVCELAPAPVPQYVQPTEEAPPKAPSPPSSPTPTSDQTTGDCGIFNQSDMKVNPVTGLPELDSDLCDGSETSTEAPHTEPSTEQPDTKSETSPNLPPEVNNVDTKEDTTKDMSLDTPMDMSEGIQMESSLDTNLNVKMDTEMDSPAVDVPTDGKPDGSVETAPEATDEAVDLSEMKSSAHTPTDNASVTPSVPETSSDSGSIGIKDTDNGEKAEAESAELKESKAMPAVPPLVPVAKAERKPGGGNKLSRLSNIIDNLRVVKEKQVLSGDGEKEDTPEGKASPQPLAKSSSLPPQLVSRPEDKKTVGGGSFTPPLSSSASHHSLQHPPSLPQQPVQQQPVQQQHKHQEPQQSQPSASRHHHSSSPSQHRKSSSALPSASSSGHSHHHLPPVSSTASSHTASSSSSKSSKPSSSSSSSGATSQPSSTASSQSSSHPSTTSFPTFPSLLSSPLAATSPLLAGGMSTSLMRQQQELALSIQQAMARGTLTNAELGQAQLMAFHMAQNEAALQASYYQKMMEMQKMTSSMSAQSKAERDFQMANLPALMQWHSRPDLLNPFLAHQHLLAAQQQQVQQQMREKELEKEKQKQQQKLREREQQQKREREREREREQQKQRQEHLELKLQQQKLQEQQQQFKQKQLQMMQDQQRKLDAAHTQFQLDMAKRDVSKRSYETMAAGLGLSVAAEQPRKAHTDAKKPRTSLPGSYPTPNLGKPRPSHTKENGSSSGSSSKGSSSSRSSALNLPVPPPVSPVAPPRLWSSSFPHSLPAPSALDMARFYGLGEDAVKHMTSMAAATNSRAAHSASATARSAPSASASSTSATASSSGSSGSGSGGGDVLDLSVKR